MCTVLLPPGDNPIAVNKYIISYHINYTRSPSQVNKVCISSYTTDYTVNISDVFSLTKCHIYVVWYRSMLPIITEM